MTVSNLKLKATRIYLQWFQMLNEWSIFVDSQLHYAPIPSMFWTTGPRLILIHNKLTFSPSRIVNVTNNFFHFKNSKTSRLFYSFFFLSFFLSFLLTFWVLKNRFWIHEKFMFQRPLRKKMIVSPILQIMLKEKLYIFKRFSTLGRDWKKEAA